MEFLLGVWGRIVGTLGGEGSLIVLAFLLAVAIYLLMGAGAGGRR
jgi:hypothetical protein